MAIWTNETWPMLKGNRASQWMCILSSTGNMCAGNVLLEQHIIFLLQGWQNSLNNVLDVQGAFQHPFQKHKRMRVMTYNKPGDPMGSACVSWQLLPSSTRARKWPSVACRQNLLSSLNILLLLLLILLPIEHLISCVWMFTPNDHGWIKTTIWLQLLSENTLCTYLQKLELENSLFRQRNEYISEHIEKKIEIRSYWWDDLVVYWVSDVASAIKKNDRKCGFRDSE